MKAQLTNTIIVCFSLILYSSLSHAQTYVDASANGNNDGSSWLNAYEDLNVALSNTTNGEIWVANGTYLPVICNPCGDPERLTFFNLPANVAIYGGFDGTETLRNQRNWQSNLTILSGDIGITNDSTDNSYRVVVAENSTSQNILDGFIIEEGNADGSSVNGTFFSGGGIYLDANPGGTANIQIRNCTMRNNFAGGGGGMAIDCVIGGVCEALIYNCSFEGNTASLGNVSSTGAGILMLGNSGAQIKPRIIKTIFENNVVGNDGGGISMTPSGATSLLATLIDSCTFINNQSTDRGAGIWYRSTQNTSQVVIRNSQFINNIAGGQGGGLFARSSFDAVSNDTLANCLFSQNISSGTSTVNDGEGGAFFYRGSQDGIRNHEIINCVFDRNFASDRGGAVGSTSFFSSGGICNGNFVNCTFYGNKTNGDGGAVHAEGTEGVNTMNFSNSIFWRDSAMEVSNEFFNNAANISLSFCNIDGGIATGTTDNGNNLNVDPQFANPENGDLHLTGCSPLINIGDNSTLLPGYTEDIEGDARVYEDVVDLGAYEVGIIYVDQNASGGNNGRTWADAFNSFQGGINRASSGDQVWVAQGSYYPVNCAPCLSADRLISFNIKPDVEIFGGFNGGESQLNERDWQSNPTILSGDIGVAIDSTDNSFRVITAENSSTKTILDGFIIEEGNADGSSVNGTVFSGGGIYLDANPGGTANIQIRNCTIRNNFAGGGGGMAIDCVIGGVCEALIYNCSFEGNTASLGNVSSTGAGILMLGNSGAQIKPRIIKTIFENNVVGNDGGGISMTPSGATSLLATLIDSCTFINNQSTDRGAGIWYRSTQNASQVVIRNSQFINNTAGGQGGGLFARSSFDAVSNDTLANCLFSQNISSGTSTVNDGEGGAFFYRGSQDGIRNHEIINCVFDRNFASDRGGAVGSTSFFSSGGICNGNFVNCTFYGNKTNGDGGAVHAEGTEGVNTMNFSNSIFWNDSTNTANNEFFNIGATIVVSFSDVQGTIPANITDGGNNINNDPQFLDASNGDLHISACSPAINSGLNSAFPLDLNQVDLDNLPRFFDTTIDLGAYEWNGMPDLMTISIQSSEISCNGFCDGSINVTPTGGVQPYNIMWFNGENTPTIDNLCPGSYSVTVSDAANCVVENLILLVENQALELSLSPNALICAGESVTILASGNGGTGNYNFEWDNGLGTDPSQNISPTESSIYNVTITDENNCSETNSIEISVIELIPQITGQLSICTGETTTLDAGTFDNYSWSTGENTQTIVVENAGTYSVTVSDANGCSGVDEVLIIENENLAPQITGQLSICTGETTTLDAGTFDNYSWSTGENTQTIVVENAGTYSVTVSDANGCSGIDEVLIIENQNLAPQITGQLSICTGETTTLDAGTFDNYSWSTGENTQTIVVENAGTYSVTVSDANGCSGMDEVLIIENESLAPQITGQLSICTGETTTLDAGTFDNYSWSTGENTQTIVVENAGTYSVTVSDANGCSGLDEVLIIENQNLAPQITGQLSICTGETTTLDAGTFDNYSWSTGENTQTIVVENAGTYEVTVSDANGCSGVDEVLIIENENLAPQITGQLSICTGETTTLDAGTFDNYSWSTGENTQTIVVENAGTYSVTVSDANGCSGIDEVLIIENQNLAPQITGQLSICTGETTTLDAGTFDNYSWSTGENTQTIVVENAGTYEVTVSDANGCSGVDEVLIIENENLAPQITGQLSICTGETTTLDAGTFDNYSWSTGENTQTIVVENAGTYSVTVSDANGCSGLDEVLIIENQNLAPQITGQLSICTGETTTLDAGTFDNYSWSTGENTQTIVVENAGTYSVTVSDANGCSGMDEVLIIENESLAPQITGQLSICTGETTTLDAGTFDNYSWSTGENTQTIVVENAGTYSVTVSDANGCSGLDEVLIIENQNLAPQITGQLSICTGTSTVLDVGDYSSYLWSTGEDIQSILVNNGGPFSVTVTDGNGCTGEDMINIIEDENLNPQITGEFTFCIGNTTVLGVGTFSNYSWSNGESTQMVVVQNAGPYSVTVTDGNGCTGEDEVNVIQTENLNPQISGEEIICIGSSTILDAGLFNTYVWSTGENTQSINVDAGGLYRVTVSDANSCSGEDEIEVNLLTVTNTEETVNLCNGEEYEGVTYFQDAEIISTETTSNGCDSTHTIRLNVFQPIILQLNIEDDCTSEGATVIASPIGENEDYNYSWSNGESGATIFGVAEGNVSVTVTDGQGCTAQNAILVEPQETLSTETEVNFVSCFGAADGAISIIVTSGLSPFTFEWSDSISTQSRIGLEPGKYSVLISDANECRVVKTFSILEPDPLQINFQTSPSTAGNNGSVFAIISGGTTPYNYEWSNSEDEVLIENLEIGNYSLTVTDLNGCSTIASIEITGTTSNTENEKIVAFELYPNPGSGKFYVNLQLTEVEEFEMEIRNAIGQKLFDIGTFTTKEIQLPIEMNKYPSGSYFLIVRTRNAVLAEHFLLIL